MKNDEEEDNNQHVRCCRVSELDANRNLPKESLLYQDILSPFLDGNAANHPSNCFSIW